MRFIEEILDNFGNPEGLSASELIEKYRYIQAIPYFGEEVNQWVEEHIRNNSVKLDLPVISGAVEAVRQITQIIPLSCYISTRPTSVKSGTKKWFRKTEFPKSRLVLQPPVELLSEWEIHDGNEWKARVLEYLYPYVNSIIDDNQDLVRYLNRDYKGRIYLFSHNSIENFPQNVYCCRDWRAVENQVKQNQLGTAARQMR